MSEQTEPAGGTQWGKRRTSGEVFCSVSSFFLDADYYFWDDLNYFFFRVISLFRIVYITYY